MSRGNTYEIGKSVAQRKTIRATDSITRIGVQRALTQNAVATGENIMRKKRHGLIIVSFLVATAVTPIVAWSFHTAAQEGAATNAFELRPSIIVDLGRHISY